MTKEILLIDDDMDELEVFAEALHSVDKGIRCTQARDLKEALEFLSYSSPAYIFIDYNMPKVNGLECVSEIKKIKKLKDSRIILYSNFVNEEMNEKAISLGAYKCVKKPNMINVLIKNLKEILNTDQSWVGK
jgi:DNA-binding NtrC family response regulator